MERDAVREALDRVEDLESVVESLKETDERRAPLCRAIQYTLKSTPPVRPVIAADVLGLAEKTVRAWANEGVLAVKQATPRLLLDAERLHEVLHLVQDLRAAGKQRGLLDEVYRRLHDGALLDREDLQESLEEMRRGEGEVIRPRPAA